MFNLISINILHFLTAVLTQFHFVAHESPTLFFGDYVEPLCKQYNLIVHRNTVDMLIEETLNSWFKILFAYADTARDYELQSIFETITCLLKCYATNIESVHPFNQQYVDLENHLIQLLKHAKTWHRAQSQLFVFAVETVTPLCLKNSIIQEQMQLLGVFDCYIPVLDSWGSQGSYDHMPRILQSIDTLCKQDQSNHTILCNVNGLLKG